MFSIFNFNKRPENSGPKIFDDKLSESNDVDVSKRPQGHTKPMTCPAEKPHSIFSVFRGSK